MAQWGNQGEVMSLRWKRMNHWKTIRALMTDAGTVLAYIQRGRRPYEYTIVFPKDAHAWGLRSVKHRSEFANPIPDFTLQDSNLATAKAVGMLIVKTQGEH
jgi:hypothetical protein